MIKNIIFDLGNVLIKWDPLNVFNEMIPEDEKRKFFFDHVCTYAWNVEQDAGRTFADATAMKIAEYPEWEPYIKAYYGRWSEMLGGAIEGSVEILKSCLANEKLNVYALTNWSAESFPIALDRFEFLQWFEGIVVSGTEKMIKPDPAIYKLILNRYGLNADESVFIDDSLDNVQGANDVGIHGIHFTSPKQLKVDLKSILGYSV